MTPEFKRKGSRGLSGMPPSGWGKDSLDSTRLTVFCLRSLGSPNSFAVHAKHTRLERFHNQLAACGAAKGGFFFHPSDEAQSLGTRGGKSHLMAVVLGYSNCGTAVTPARVKRLASGAETIEGESWLPCPTTTRF